MTEMTRAGTFSAGIARIPGLAAMLEVGEVVSLRRHPSAAVDVVVGWGRKSNTNVARRYAAVRALPYWNLEDGFLRSVGLGIEGAPPLSVVVDPIGVHYDARSESLLEWWLAGSEMPAAGSLEDPAVLARAERLRASLVEAGISKYNRGRSTPADERALEGAGARGRVLVVDQSGGDLSLTLGMAPESIDDVVRAALAENPTSEVWVKPHPDVLARPRTRRGAPPESTPDWLGHPRVRLVQGHVQPAALLRNVDSVYTRTSLMGFEALWYGKTVHCFGMPFYAGWGLTVDRVSCPRRGRRRSLGQLVAAALLFYPRYLDPETGAASTPERVVEHLTLQRRFLSQDPAPLVCVGFSPWKRGFVPAYLGARAADVRFVPNARMRMPRALPAAGVVVAWSSRELGPSMRYAAMHGAPLVRMEDGFLRSVGLGSDLVAPLSLVLDRTGIYYDPGRPSDLETALATYPFGDADRDRGRALRERIVATGVSKYVLAEARALPHDRMAGREVVLVVGQVEDDASIARGCVDIRSNEALLREARRSRADAFVIYRPHPDVTLGGRIGAVERPVERGFADFDATGVDLALCLAHANEVHTLTSLVGFEALLRGMRVVTHGLPFYAGWGLTEDRVRVHPALGRRTRRLTIDELAFGTLVLYPRYVHPVSGEFTTPERILEHLTRARARVRAAAGVDGVESSVPAPNWAGRRARLIRRFRNLARDARTRFRRG